MAGPTFSFVGFGLLVALLVSVRPSLEWRRGILLLASAVFLATFSRDPVAFAPFAGFLLAGYVAMRIVERYPQRAMPFAVATIVLLFAWLKRYSFIPHSALIPAPYVTVGLSYILFRLLHLIIEIPGDATLTRLPVRVYLGYLIGFNTLLAGPIQPYDEYAAEQDPTTWRVTLGDAGEALNRIVIGLFKTNVLAALLASLRDAALANISGDVTTPMRLVSAAAVFALYPLFLYCNFAGYIDIVIGLSRLMGRRLPENFNRPFAAASVIAFWNSWHITLSAWLKRYVFNPLLIALCRRFPARSLEPLLAVVAFFVTFFLVGIWHGQTTAFLVFGLLTGLGVSVNKLFQVVMSSLLGRKPYAEVAARPAYVMVARGLTFAWFAFTLTWFWASWSDASNLWGELSPKRWVVVWAGIVAAASIALAAWELLRSRWLAIEWNSRNPLTLVRAKTAWLTTLLVVAVIVVLISTHAAPALVYKDF